MWRQFGLGIILLLVCAPAFLVVLHGVLSFSPSWAMHLATTVLPGYLYATGLTFVVGAGVAGIIGGLGAALTHGYDFWGRRLAVFSQLLPLTMPAYVTASIWAELRDGSIFALGVVHGAAASPLVFILIRLGLARIPDGLRAAAATLGSGIQRRILLVYLPLLTVAGLACFLLVAAAVFGDEAAARRLGVTTLAVGLLDQWQVMQREDLATLLTLILSLLASLCLLPICRWIVKNPRMIAAESKSSRRAMVGWRGVALLLLCLILAMPGFFVPLSICLIWSSVRLHRIDLSPVFEDMLSTLLTSVATMAIVVAFTFALMALAQPGAKARRWEAALWIPSLSYLIPSLVFALAWLQFGSWMGWDGASRWMIVTAASVRFFPLALLPAVAALAALPEQWLDSARTLGETRFGTFRRVIIPVVWPTIAAGGLLVFVESVKELTLSQLLQPFGYRALSLRIGALTTIHLIRDAAVWVIVSTLISVIPVWILTSALEPEEGWYA